MQFQTHHPNPQPTNREAWCSTTRQPWSFCCSQIRNFLFCCSLFFVYPLQLFLNFISFNFFLFARAWMDLVSLSIKISGPKPSLSSTKLTRLKTTGSPFVIHSETQLWEDKYILAILQNWFCHALIDFRCKSRSKHTSYKYISAASSGNRS